MHFREARLLVEPVSAIWVAAPWTTTKLRLPVASPEAVASRLTVPARAPVTVLVATPAEAVELPRPVTLPSPPDWPNATTVVLSEVATLPAASLSVAVSTRVAPEVRFAVEPVSSICVAAPAVTVKEPSVPVVSPLAVASIATVPAAAPVTAFVAIPFAAVAVPVPVTVPVPEAFANVTTVELSEVTVFPAASTSVAVRTRASPEARSAVEPVRTTSLAVPCVTTKLRLPVESPAEPAWRLTVPASAPVTVLVATPELAVAFPVPVTLPRPPSCAKLTTVELSVVTTFPAASVIVAVSTRVAPEARFAVEPLSAMSVAAPGVTVKAPRVPVVRPLAVACMVTEPATPPVTVFVATPFEAVSDPVPVTLPAPEAWPNETTVELSEVTVLPAASCTVAVNRRVEPEARLPTEPVRPIWAAAPWTIVKSASVPVVSPLAVASRPIVPARTAVTVFVATPELAVALPVPDTVADPEALPNATTVVLSDVTVLPAASWIVAVRSRVAPEVRFAVEPVSSICAAAPWTTVKAPRVPVVRPLAVACSVTLPTSAPVTAREATPLEAVAVPVAETLPVPDACVKLTTVELSLVTVLPAASTSVAVRIRLLPEVRLAVEPLSEIAEAAPCVTTKLVLPVVRPAEVASRFTVPASAPVTVLVATPAEAVALPVPLTVPSPPDWAKATTVELSEVTVLPAASFRVAVRMRVEPEARSAVEAVRSIWAAPPAVTVKAPRVPVVRPIAVASIVTEPASWPVTAFDATPAEAVAVPVPVTVPAPEAWAKVTTVLLSEVTVLPAASTSVAVRMRFEPDARSAVEPERAMSAAGPCTTVKAPRVPVVRPLAVASIVTVPTSAPVTAFVAIPLDAVAVPVPVTLPAPDALAKVTTVLLSEVTTLPAASLIVAVRTRFEPDVRLAVEPVSSTCAAAPGTTTKLSAPAVSPADVPWRLTVPARAPVTVLVATPLEAVAFPSPVTLPSPPDWANATTVELSEVTTLPAASFRVAVRSRVVPEARFAVEPVTSIWAAAPATTVKVPSVPVVSPLAVASIVTVPASAPVTA